MYTELVHRQFHFTQHHMQRLLKGIALAPSVLDMFKGAGGTSLQDSAIW